MDNKSKFPDPNWHNGANRGNDSERIGLEGIANWVTNDTDFSASKPPINIKIISEREICNICNEATRNFENVMLDKGFPKPNIRTLSGTKTAYPDID